MRLRKALLAASILAAPVAAKAAVIDGFYIGGGAGGNYLDDLKIKKLTTPTLPGAIAPQNPGKVRTNWGFGGVLSAGYGFGNGLRAEIEGNYRQNSIRKLTTTATPTFAGGDVKQYGGMVNVLYDFDFAALGLAAVDTFLPNPYVGVGVGYGQTQFQSFRAFSSTNTSFVRGIGNPSDGNVAYQGIAGVAFPLDAYVPGLALTAEYRYYGIASGNSLRYQAAAPAEAPISGKFKIDDTGNHSVLLGLRYNIGVEAPPVAQTPPPVPPPAATRNYLVFFDWDRADLTARARQIIGQAAQASRSAQTTRLEVNGYTDTSGTAAYNQRLSVRRAQSVAAELVRDGVARNEISIQGFGETNLLVPTAQGVREPQNRRVEIILH